MLISLASYAQKHKHKKAAADEAPPPPRVWLANIHTYYGSKDSVLAKPMLSTDSVGCRPSGFTVSLQAPGHDFYGPLYSNTWEMTQAQKDAIIKWDYPNTTLYIQDIHLNCHEKDAVAPPFKILLTP
jgi:hypothetical protein